ncbi:MAG: hypothetical protein C4320_01375 [Armatimonadota bacterium]
MIVVHRGAEYGKAVGIGATCASIFIAAKVGSAILDSVYTPKVPPPAAASVTSDPVIGSPALAFLPRTEGRLTLVIFGDCDSCALIGSEVMQKLPKGRKVIAVRQAPLAQSHRRPLAVNNYRVEPMSASELSPLHPYFSPRIYRFGRGRLEWILGHPLQESEFIAELSK